MIKKIYIYQLRIPFQFQIIHNLAKRNTGESILVIAEDDDGITGCGEGTPREYVTGETILKSITAANSLANNLSTINFSSPADLIQSLAEFGQSNSIKSSPSAWCAIETACLDLFAKKTNLPYWKFFSGSIAHNEFAYSAVIPMLPITIQDSIFDLISKNKIQNVKLKVDDVVTGVDQVKYARNKLGSDINIRVDANAAFTALETIDFLKKVKKFSISALEQPVSKENLEAFREIKSNSDDVLIIADESLSSIEDATKLINNDACHGFNIRLSKCGGIINCIELCTLAHRNNLIYQIGCHVGESSILSAAGRHLASICQEHLFLEGSFSKYMLVDDITNEEISFGYKGRADNLDGPGLGVSINYDKLNKWAELKHTITFK